MVPCIGQQVLQQDSYPLPPGPRGIPWVGNVIGVDANKPYTTYMEWSKKYSSDIVYSRLLGNDIIVLNSEKVAKDLFEDRSRNYSDRPYSITSEKCGLGFNSVFLPYGDSWRQTRRFFHQTFSPDTVHRFLPSQHRKTGHFLSQVLESPERLNDHVFEYTSAVVMNSAYDYEPAFPKDKFVEMVTDAVSIAVPLISPGFAVAIGAFPWVLRLPAWFPGMSFKKKMATASELSKQYLEEPFEYALQKLRGGSVAPSMVQDGMRETEEDRILPEASSWLNALKGASASTFIAASETSNSILMTFFMMMVANQEAQQRAQTEIDAVVGKDRLPTMSDRPSLPFIDAIFRETLRYNPVAPLSVPHAALDDDVYEGFRIPKGSILLANVWAISRDESRYPNADAFIPERFVNEDGSLKPNSIEHIAYGFGERVCAGKYFADAFMWLLMARALAVFEIARPVDENGVEVPVEPGLSTGNLIRPLPFGYRILPRFPEMDRQKLDQLIAASSP